MNMPSILSLAVAGLLVAPVHAATAPSEPVSYTHLHAARHHIHLAGAQVHRAVAEIDAQATGEDDEGLVGVGVAVPDEVAFDLHQLCLLYTSGHRHDQDHRQRQAPALVLGGQHEEGQQHAEREDEQRGIAGEDLLVGQLGPLAVSYTHLDVYKRQGIVGLVDLVDAAGQDPPVAHQHGAERAAAGLDVGAGEGDGLAHEDFIGHVFLPVSYTHLNGK